MTIKTSVILNLKNMKKILLSLFVIAGVLSASAQGRIFNNPNNKPYFGLRATLDVPTPCNFNLNDYEDHYTLSKKVFDAGVGFSVGGVYNIPIVANFYIEPGLSFYYNAMPIKTDDIDDILDELEEVGGELVCHSVRQSGMRIPVAFGYHFDFTRDFNVAVYMGPVINLGFSMDYYIKAKVKDVEVKETGSMYKAENPDDDDRFNRFNLDWRIGVGVNYKNFFGGLSGDIGMTNAYHVAKDNKRFYSASYHQNLFQLTVGYNFK